MTEKVLFELRLTEDETGTHMRVSESPEWKAYQRDPLYQTPPLPPMPPIMKKTFRRRIAEAEEDLREAVDSLQAIYDDLYGTSEEVSKKE